MVRKFWNKKRCLEKCRAPHSWRASPNKRGAVRQRTLHKHSLTLCPAWHPNFFMLSLLEFGLNLTYFHGSHSNFLSFSGPKFLGCIAGMRKLQKLSPLCGSWELDLLDHRLKVMLRHQVDTKGLRLCLFFFQFRFFESNFHSFLREKWVG